MAGLNPLDPSASLPGQLNQLEQANLIRLASAVPELEYLFRHALIQESAYHTLVRADRRRVHRAAGEALEALLAGREPPIELAPQLARHFEEAADYARAARYYTLAGDAALAGYANVEAVAAYSSALAAAERASAGAERSSVGAERAAAGAERASAGAERSATGVERAAVTATVAAGAERSAAGAERAAVTATVAAAVWRHLFEARGRALELNSQFPEALANYQSMAERGRALGDPRLALAAEVAAGQLHATITPLFDPPRAEQMAEAALREARALGDEAAEAKILWNQLNLNRLIQRQPQARAAGERSLEIARRLGLQAQAAASVHDLAHVYAEMGLWPESEHASAEARQGWQALGNSAMLADNLATAALYHGLRGQFAAALGEAQAAFQHAQAIGNLWGQAYSLLTAVWPHWYTGYPDRAFETADACMRAGATAATFTLVTAAWKGFMYAELGDTASGLEWTRQAAEAIQYLGGLGRVTVLAVRVHLELTANNVTQAAASLEAIEQESQHPAIFEVDSVLRARAEMALARGEPGLALAATQAHVAVLRERGLLQSLPAALGELAQAWLLAGRATEARVALAEALAGAQAIGAVMLEWRVRYDLGRLDLDSGDAASGRRQWARAREIVIAIADHIPTPELRRAFRARPELRALMGDDGA